MAFRQRLMRRLKWSKTEEKRWRDNGEVATFFPSAEGRSGEECGVFLELRPSSAAWLHPQANRQLECACTHTRTNTHTL